MAAASASTVGFLSALAVLSLLLASVECGEVRIQTFTDKSCQSVAENLDIILKANDELRTSIRMPSREDGRFGLGTTLNVKTFESAIVSIAVDVNSVVACQRGFACNGAGANQISFLGIIGVCATGNQGTQFDKILIT